MQQEDMTGSRMSSRVQSANTAADMPTYMRKDSYGYKFVRPIPQKLQSLFGKANFIQRLGKNYSKAKSECLRLALDTENKIEKAKQAQQQVSSVEDYLKLPPSARITRIKTSPELAGSISSLWLHTLDAEVIPPPNQRLEK